MSIHRNPFRRQAETDHVVAPVLEALRAPARTSELRRESEAVAAFQAARLTPPTPRSDMTTARSAAARAAIATGVVVALSSGGFALAATDNLPNLPDQASDQATESVAKNRATTAPTTAATTTTATADPTETEKPKKPKKVKSPKPDKPSSTGAPSPSFEGLCNAFQNHKKVDGKWLNSAAFTALATEAGEEGIAAFCVDLIGEPTAKVTKVPKPDKPAKEAKPTKAPKTTKAKPSKAPKAKDAAKGKSGDAGKR